MVGILNRVSHSDGQHMLPLGSGWFELLTKNHCHVQPKTPSLPQVNRRPRDLGTAHCAHPYSTTRPNAAPPN